MARVLDPPKGAKVDGKRLWRAILAEYDLEEHELSLLRQAVRCADLCADLQAIVDADGPMLAGGEGGPRTHPAVIELRQQRITLARLVVALRVPLGEDEAPRTQRRGIRGVYQGGVA